MDDQITVVKCGGAATIAHDALCAEIAALQRNGRRVLLVHGGAAELDRLAARLGLPQRRLTTPSGSSSRYTDPATLEVLTMALAGKVKPGLLAALARAGARAVGLTGLDAGLLTARRTAVHRAVLDGRKVVIRDDHNGRLTRVDPQLLRTLFAADVVPVVSPPALGEDGHPVNVDADRVATALAGALGAAELVFLTGAPGLLRDPADETSVVGRLELSPAEPPSPEIAGAGMTVKLQAAHDALLAGVGRVLIADGRRTGPLTAALAGQGTTVTLSEPVRTPAGS
ncbi:[LysW]-aminoadipate kinase [Micromonospora sp. WMMA1923]